MENENIPQDLLLPHREIKVPSRSLSEVNPVQAMGNPLQPLRSTTMTNPMVIGQPLWILHLDPRPKPVSARLGIIQLHQHIGIHSTDPIHTGTRRRRRINPNRRQQKQTQPEITMRKKRTTSKITHNKDGRCFEIESYRVKARGDQKPLQDIIPSLHSLQPRSHRYRLLPNY
jgi:hypothetical protein